MKIIRNLQAAFIFGMRGWLTLEKAINLIHSDYYTKKTNIKHRISLKAGKIIKFTTHSRKSLRELNQLSYPNKASH